MLSSKSNSSSIGITLGDPGGIGPEVVAKALKALPHSAGKYIIVGDEVVFRKFQIMESSSVQLIRMANLTSYGQVKHRVSRKNGKAAMSYLLVATELLKTRIISALVTAPVSKEAIALTHPNFIGHTEFLAESFAKKHVEMMFVHKDLRVFIVTRHVPLHAVSHHLTQKNVTRTILLADQALKKLFNFRQPHLAVCGVNPHAGEGGLLGREEIRSIIPAIKQARLRGVKVSGPLAADTLFTSVNIKRFDAFIAMYHDQGLIPAKTLYFDQLVNLTVGLPFIRTSPDHGTAFDIAGKGKADPGSMIEAIKLADRLSRSCAL